MKATTRALSLTGAFTLVVVALTGCAAPMTTEEACTYLDTEITAYMDTVDDDLTAASEDFDLDKIITIQKTMLDKFETIGNDVNNAEVKSSFGTFISLTKETIPFLEKMFKDDDMSVLDSDEFKDLDERGLAAGEELGKLCPTVSITP